MYTCIYTLLKFKPVKGQLNICVAYMFSLQIFYVEKYVGSKYQRLHPNIRGCTHSTLTFSDPSAWHRVRVLSAFMDFFKMDAMFEEACFFQLSQYPPYTLNARVSHCLCLCLFFASVFPLTPSIYVPSIKIPPIIFLQV